MLMRPIPEAPPRSCLALGRGPPWRLLRPLTELGQRQGRSRLPGLSQPRSRSPRPGGSSMQIHSVPLDTSLKDWLNRLSRTQFHCPKPDTESGISPPPVPSGTRGRGKAYGNPHSQEPFMSSEGPASLLASEPSDPAGFHRRLAHWNHRRLAPATPGRAWRDDVRHDAEMMLVEGDFIERARVEAAPWLADLPTTADGFIAWFEALKGSGPGEADPLFPWLAETASMEEMRWFLLQEVAGEAGFEDLVAMAQVKMPARPKLELARNYWDEMGRGSEAGMHGPMLDRLAAALDLHPRIEETAWPSLALGNTLV